MTCLSSAGPGVAAAAPTELTAQPRSPADPAHRFSVSRVTHPHCTAIYQQKHRARIEPDAVPPIRASDIGLPGSCRQSLTQCRLPGEAHVDLAFDEGPFFG